MLTCINALRRAKISWCQPHMEPLGTLGVFLAYPLCCHTFPAAGPEALAWAGAGAAWEGHS